MAFKDDKPKLTDTEAGCRYAHARIESYNSFTGYGDVYRAAAWTTWATGRILSGWTADAVIDRFREAWKEHCRRTGRALVFTNANPALVREMDALYHRIMDDALTPERTAHELAIIAARHDAPDILAMAERYRTYGEVWANALGEHDAANKSSRVEAFSFAPGVQQQIAGSWHDTH